MNHHRLSLIIQREYLSIVAKKSFIFMTLLMPLLIIALGSIPILLQELNSSDEAKKVAIIDESGEFGKAIENNDDFQFVVLDNNQASSPHEYYKEADGSIYAIVIIPQNILETKQLNVFSDNTINMSLLSHIENRLNEILSDAKLASYNVEGLKAIIEDCNVEVTINSIKWDETGETTMSSTELSMIIGMVLSLVIYMFVLTYGAMIMNSVVEEKTNRIVEVIVSSCKPFELMMGKIIGVALVGLTQIAIWAVILSTISSIIGVAVVTPAIDPTMVAASGTEIPEANGFGEFMQIINGVNFIQILVFFIIYFVGGFLLYASLFAGFGSAVDEASDASQFTMPIMIVIIIALYAGLACLENPDGQMAVWCSIIPFTSPIVMMIRLPYDVPIWQMIASIIALYGTAVLCIYLSARIYRTGILLYGKKRSLKDVIKWIKQ